MRRARRLIPIICVALAAATVSDAARQTVDMINGIGIIDYASRPVMKVGSWAKYHMTGSSEMGESDDYTVTVVIAGDERFWGEDCFWVETWTEPKGKPPRALATLMSYSVFEDSLPNIRSQYYIRKSIDGVTADGALNETLVRRPPSTLKTRGTLLETPNIKLDTLGTDTVSVLGNTLTCKKVSWQEGKAGTLERRDSTVTTELRENRMIYLSREIPVTGVVREDLERIIRRRSWAVGRSQEAANWITMDRATGAARLIGFGGDAEPRLLPKERQVTLKQIDEAAARAARPAKPAARRKS